MSVENPLNNPPQENPNPEGKNKFGTNPEGLGAEQNRQIAEHLQNGNYEGLLDILQTSGDKNRACEVIINSMFDFHQKDRADSVNSLVSRALSNVDQYGDALKSLVLYSWNNHLRGERFFQNPTNGETLFLDGDGELISFKGEIATHTQGDIKGMNYVRTLDSYTVLTGPNKGKTFSGTERPIPAPK